MLSGEINRAEKEYDIYRVEEEREIDLQGRIV